MVYLVYNVYRYTFPAKTIVDEYMHSQSHLMRSRRAGRKGRNLVDMSGIECCEHGTTGHHATVGRRKKAVKTVRDGRSSRERPWWEPADKDQTKKEGPISLWQALLDKHTTWAGVTIERDVANDPWPDMEDYNIEELIHLPDDDDVKQNPWVEQGFL
jgi:hypothetical protein